jgi:hypothetical protein
MKSGELVDPKGGRTSADAGEDPRHLVRYRDRRRMAGRQIHLAPSRAAARPAAARLLRREGRIGEGHEGAGPAVADGVPQRQWRLVVGERLWRHPPAQPVCHGTLGDPERGECREGWRERRHTAAALPRRLPPCLGDLGRQRIEEAPATLKDVGVEEDEVPDPLRQAVGDAGDRGAPKAVPGPG